MSYQLHLVPELHLASVVPVAQVAVNQQDHQRQDDGQDLRRQTNVAAWEEGQSQNAKQHLQQHQGDVSTHDVVQISLPVLLAVLERVHLAGVDSYCVVEITSVYISVQNMNEESMNKCLFLCQEEVSDINLAYWDNSCNYYFMD